MYIRRDVENDLLRLSRQYPVVTVTGPRQSGKTTLCEHVFPEYRYISLEEIHLREFANNDPVGFLDELGDAAVIDEIQRVPNLLSYIQVRVDKVQKNGNYILTGSSQFELSETVSQSLVGRTALVELLPFSYSELHRSRKSEKPGLNETLFRGFYPRIFDQNLDPSEMYSFYVRTYLERDVRRLINVRDINMFGNFLKLAAGRNGNIVNYSSLADDCGIDVNTARQWLSVLALSYILRLTPPYHNNLNKRVIKAPKLFFYDTGLVCYLLGMRKPEHLSGHPLAGSIFESFVYSELAKGLLNRIQTDSIHHYRDGRGREVDLILDKVNTICPIEVKKGRTVNNHLFKGLRYLQSTYGNIGNSYLVYGGNENYHREGIGIISWREICQIIDKELE